MRLINNDRFAADAKICCTASKDGLPQHFTDAVSRICACVFSLPSGQRLHMVVNHVAALSQWGQTSHAPEGGPPVSNNL